MKYTSEYMDIFMMARYELRKAITKMVQYVKWCQVNKLPVSLEYLCIIAERITAYNELTSIEPLYNTEDF